MEETETVRILPKPALERAGAATGALLSLLVEYHSRLTVLEALTAGSRTTASPTTAAPSAAVAASTEVTTPLLPRLLGALTDRELTLVANDFGCADQLDAFVLWFSMPVPDASGMREQAQALLTSRKLARSSSAAHLAAAPAGPPSGGSLDFADKIAIAKEAREAGAKMREVTP